MNKTRIESAFDLLEQRAILQLFLRFAQHAGHFCHHFRRVGEKSCSEKFLGDGATLGRPIGLPRVAPSPRNFSLQLFSPTRRKWWQKWPACWAKRRKS